MGSLGGVKLAPGKASTVEGKSFQGVMKEIETPAKTIPQDPFKAMEHLTQRISQREKLAPAELIQYQVKAGEFGMQVELVSKVGESLSASLRKLQQQG